MAKEMMNFTKLQIMLQAGTSMLAQANALPQNVLSLIR
jgi:flagellin